MAIIPILSPYFFATGFYHVIVAFADQFCFFLNRNPIIIHMESIKCVFLGNTFNNEGLNAQSGKKLGSSTSGITFLDSAGQRAFSNRPKASLSLQPQFR